MNDQLHLNAKGLIQLSWEKSTGESAFIDLRITPGTRHDDVVSALGNTVVSLVIEDIVSEKITFETARAFLNFSNDLEDRILRFVERQKAQQEADAIFNEVFPNKEAHDE